MKHAIFFQTLKSREGTGIGTHRDMDTISMLLTGWIIFVFLAIAAVKFLYLRFVKKSSVDEKVEQSDSTSELKNNVAKEASQQLSSSSFTTSKIVETVTGPKLIQSNRPQRPLRRRRISKDYAKDLGSSFDDSIIDSLLGSTSANKSTSSGITGPDPAVVDYVTKLHDWLLKDQPERPLEEIREAFIDAMNRSLRKSDKNELSISIVNASVDDTLKLSNIFAECIKQNTVKVTADCEVKMKGELTASNKEIGIRRCEFFVDRLNGRLSSQVETKNKVSVFKLDGWPEICVTISKVSPSKGNAGLDSKVTEAIADRITTTLRNAVVEVELERLQNLPDAPEFNPIEDDSKKYLLVKVVRGVDLGAEAKGCSEPYVVLELDDPAQKFQTSVQESNSPVWNENFVFNVIPGTGQLLLEVHDKTGSKFLGCNLLSVEEIGDEKNRTLPLKSRRMELSGNGSIDVQFTFLDEKEFKSREIIEKVSSNGNLIKTTRTVYTKPPDANSGAFTENASIETASDNGGGIPGQYGDDRGRRKTRRGDIFTSLRRRLSKTRSHSVVTEGREEGGEGNDTAAEKDDAFKRSLSADRQSLLSQGRLTLGGLGSARSSVSELSAISGHSTTTYVHENSTLVIECMENRLRKYYLVPPHLAESGKWKKRGKKLHIYNDHTFVAKHIPSGKMCEICTTRLPFALGKQGYQCRDCKMICHKECHVRAPSYCPKTTVYDIELEYFPSSGTS